MIFFKIKIYYFFEYPKLTILKRKKDDLVI